MQNSLFSLAIDKMGVTVAVEGAVDAAVAERIIASTGLHLGPVHGQRGKQWLDRQLLGYNQAARFGPWLVLRDLDRDASCAPELRRDLLTAPASLMQFRIAVRAVEAWLLADHKGVARFLRIPVSRVPARPEDLLDPKTTMIELARNSRSRAIRDDMVPVSRTGSRVGPAYTARLIEFTMQAWHLETAAERSDSLSRCIGALSRLSSE
jgi:hypothetical protein